MTVDDDAALSLDHAAQNHLRQEKGAGQVEHHHCFIVCLDVDCTERSEAAQTVDAVSAAQFCLDDVASDPMARSFFSISLASASCEL